MSDEAAPRQSFTDKHRKVLLGSLAVAMFIAAWQAAFLFVPFNKLFISKPDLIWNALVDLIVSGDLLRDLLAGERRHPCGREFDPQWQPFHRSTDAGYIGLVAIPEDKAGAHTLRPLQK